MDVKITTSEPSANYKVRNRRPKERVLKAIEEAEDISRNPDKYPVFDSVEDLMKDLLS